MKKQLAKSKSSLVPAARYAVAIYRIYIGHIASELAGMSIHPEVQHNPSIVQAAPIQTSSPPQFVAVPLWTPPGIMDHLVRLTNYLTSSVATIHHMHCNHPLSCHRPNIHH